MHFEVEQKHRIDDREALIAKLAERGAVLGPAVVQVDQYFAHPARDFAQTDEALRIRTLGGASIITYKGPKLDSTTKTRRELELPLDAGDVGGRRFAGLLATLGFRPVAIVRKRRRTFHLDHEGHQVEGALDAVDSVGVYVELELMANEAELPLAQRIVASLASELDLGPSERRSYLELLLSK
jgi:adenylate cyclase class 2